MNAQQVLHNRIRNRDYPYFRRTWKIVVLVLLTAAFLPMLLLGGGMYYYSGHLLYQNSLQHLRIQLDLQAGALEGSLAASSADKNVIQETADVKMEEKLSTLERVGRGRLMIIDVHNDQAVPAGGQEEVSRLLSGADVSSLLEKKMLETKKRLFLVRPLAGTSRHLVLWADKANIFPGIRLVRLFFFSGLILGGILISLAVLLTTDYLVNRLEEKRRALLHMDRQILQVSHMASSMRLCPGFLRAIKDNLVNIDALSASNPERDQGNQDWLEPVRSQARQAIASIDGFLGFIRLPGTAWRIEKIGINSIIQELLEFCRHELEAGNISVHEDLDPDLPLVRSNLSRLHQLFQNLFLTVLSDIAESGDFRIATRASHMGVRVDLSYPWTGRLHFPLSHVHEHFQLGSESGYEPWPALCVDLVQKLQGTITGGRTNGNRVWLRLELPVELDR